jgi:hypothetical protein
MKTEFVYVTPKNLDAKDIFMHDMDRLHSCRIKDRKRWNDETGKYLWAVCFLDERER